MSDDSTVSQDRSFGQRVKHGLESKILVPAAATIVTVAVKYLLKKLPVLLEEKVLPKLQEQNVPERVTNAVEGTATALGGTNEDGAPRAEDAAEPQEPAPAETTNADREAERRKREQRRQQRKRALEKAA